MEEGKLVKPNVLNKPVQDASDLIRSKQKKQESRARGEYELRTIMKKITTIAETRGSHKEYHVANFATFVSKTLTFSLQKWMNLISDQLSTASIKYLNVSSPVFG